MWKSWGKETGKEANHSRTNEDVVSREQRIMVGENGPPPRLVSDDGCVLSSVLCLTIATTIVEMKWNEMKKESYDISFRDETGLGAVPQ